jgi:hypothetical protein
MYYTPFVAADNAHAYLTAYPRTGSRVPELEVVDISNPDGPVLMGRLTVSGSPQGLALSGSQLFWTDAVRDLRVIDVSNPSQPFEAAHYTSGHNSFGIAVRGGLAYVAAGDAFSVFRFTPSAASDRSTPPGKFALHPAYPNPFNNSTRIGFSLPRTEKIELSLYDVLGRKVRDITDQVYQPGENEVIFHAYGLSSGVYFVRLIPPGEGMQKIIILR